MQQKSIFQWWKQTFLFSEEIKLPCLWLSPVRYVLNREESAEWNSDVKQKGGKGGIKKGYISEGGEKGSKLTIKFINYGSPDSH